MIECIHCNNNEKKTFIQHDSSLVGYGDYGRLFTCLKCRKTCHSNAKDIEIEEFMEQK